VSWNTTEPFCSIYTRDELYRKLPMKTVQTHVYVDNAEFTFTTEW